MERQTFIPREVEETLCKAVGRQGAHYLTESEARADIFIMGQCDGCFALLLNNPRVELRQGQFSKVDNGYKARAPFYIVKREELARLKQSFTCATSKFMKLRPQKRNEEYII